jgi:hypothetical protein
MGWWPAWLEPFARPIRRYTFCWRHRLCVRASIKPNNWKNKSPSNPQDVELAASDLEPRPKDNGELSVYATWTLEQAKQVVLLHRVVFTKPGPTYFLAIPPVLLRGIILDIRRDRGTLHPLLAQHHYVVAGLTDEAARLKLAERILQNFQSVQIEGWTNGEVKKAATPLVADAAIKKIMVYPNSW